MQEKWDDIDNMIFNSIEDIKISPDYNKDLMNKINEEILIEETSFKTTSIFYKRRVAAFSLIMSGFLMMLITTTNFQYNIIDAASKIRNEVIAVEYEYNYKLDCFKNMIGE